MDKLVARALILASLVLAAPASGAVDGFILLNQTGAALRDVALRRVGGGAWHPLALAPAPGASARASFKQAIARSISARPSLGLVRSCGAGSIFAT